MVFEAWHIWLIVGIALMVLEIFTPSFVAGSFGIGAIFTSLVAYFSDNINIQILFFTGFSILAFVLIRPLLKRIEKKRETATNMDSLIGQSLMVVEEIGPDQKPGYTKVDGDMWRTISIQGEHFTVGEKAKVIRIDGNTLYVEKITL